MKKSVIIACIILALAAIAAAVLFIIPVSSKTFEIKDRCGNVRGIIMNTIQEASTCSSLCYSQCAAEGYKKHESQFKNGTVCNTCLCLCRNTIL